MLHKNLNAKLPRHLIKLLSYTTATTIYLAPIIAFIYLYQVFLEVNVVSDVFVDGHWETVIKNEEEKHFWKEAHWEKHNSFTWHIWVLWYTVLPIIEVFLMWKLTGFKTKSRFWRKYRRHLNGLGSSHKYEILDLEINFTTLIMARSVLVFALLITNGLFNYLPELRFEY